MSTEKIHISEFSEIIQRMMKAKGWNHEKEVVQALKMKGPAFSERKTRNSTPVDKIRLWCMDESINPEWLLTGEGSMHQDTAVSTPINLSYRSVPIISNATAGDFGFWEDLGDASERIEIPASITDPHAFAFRIVGESMFPRYKHGEVVVCDTTKPVHNNDDVVVRLHDGAVMAKIYKYSSGMVFLESYNHEVETIPILDGDMVKCFKIVCRL